MFSQCDSVGLRAWAASVSRVDETIVEVATTAPSQTSEQHKEGKGRHRQVSIGKDLFAD